MSKKESNKSGLHINCTNEAKLESTMVASNRQQGSLVYISTEAMTFRFPV